MANVSIPPPHQTWEHALRFRRSTSPRQGQYRVRFGYTVDLSDGYRLPDGELLVGATSLSLVSTMSESRSLPPREVLKPVPRRVQPALSLTSGKTVIRPLYFGKSPSATNHALDRGRRASKEHAGRALPSQPSETRGSRRSRVPEKSLFHG